jgi:L-ribulose-5-phosphate 3-epimerase
MQTCDHISRREFVQATAAGMLASAGVLLAASRAAQHTQPSRTIKLAVKFGMIGAGATVLEKFQVIRDCGFDGVELDSPSNLDHDEVLKARDAAGITISGVVDSVHWQHTLSHPDQSVRDKGRQALETALRECKIYGGTSVLLVPAVVNKDVSYADAYVRSQAEIRKVLPLARQLNVRIAIENVWNNFLLSPLEAARYVDELGSDVVGWHFDVGNVVNYGWPAHWIRILGRRIVKLDIKEFSRAKRDKEGLWRGFDVEIGEGDCDWADVRQALAEISFASWACAEVAGGDVARLRDLARRMNRVLFASDE